jgi:hypothetical protein
MLITGLPSGCGTGINQKRSAIMRKIDRMTHTTIVKIIPILYCLVITACTPTVKVESPQEPITINLNIKLDADIRIKLEEEAKKDIAANPGIF